MPGKLFIISAPSGAGKTTLVTELLQKHGNHYDLHQVITYTSRPPRPSDQHGIDYHFIKHHEFEQKIKEGFFIEWSQAYGHYYGTPSDILKKLETGLSCILIIDRIGAQAIIRHYPAAILIWIYTQDITTLHQRLVLRNTETPEIIAKRLLLAQQEINQEFLGSIYHYKVLNECKIQALKDLVAIIEKSLFLDCQKKILKK